MKIQVCDICGENLFKKQKKHLFLHPIKIKIKKFNESNYIGVADTWDKMDICTECAEKIYEYCRDNKWR